MMTMTATCSVADEDMFHLPDEDVPPGTHVDLEGSPATAGGCKTALRTENMEVPKSDAQKEGRRKKQVRQLQPRQGRVGPHVQSVFTFSQNEVLFLHENALALYYFR